MDLQSQGPGLIESVSRLIVSVIPEDFFFEADSCCVDCDIVEIERLSAISEEVVGELGVLSPIFHCA